MALLDCESFAFSTSITDFKNYGLFVGTVAGNVSLVTTGGPLGDPYVTLGYDSSLRRATPAGSSSVFWGSRINLFGLGGLQMTIRDTLGNAHITVAFNALGGAAVYRGDTSGTLIYVYPFGTVPPTGWAYVEIVAAIDPSVGYVGMFVNGYYSGTGCFGNTQGGPTPTIGVVNWYCGAVSATPGVAHYYIADDTGTICNSVLGDSRVKAMAAATAASTGFGYTGTSNLANISSAVPGTAGVNTTTTLAATDLFTFTPVAGASAYNSIRFLAGAMKTDSGGRSLATKCRSVQGPTEGLAVSGSTAQQIASVDPSTGLPWTASGVATMQAGYTLAA